MNDVFGNIGRLMHLPLEKIEPAEENFVESEFILMGAADALLQAGGRNWIPLIVKETGDYQYQVVANIFIYAVAQQTNLERVWCIVIPSDEKIIQQAKLLAREVPPKVNLNTASREMIMAALKYLVESPEKPLKQVDIIIAANRISEAKDRETWENFSPISKLKCKLTANKLELLSKVFYLSPLKPVPPPPPPASVNIKRASRDEIFERLKYLSTYKIGGFETVDAEKVADVIFSADKSKWKTTLNPIEKLNCGISKKMIGELKNVFTLSGTDDNPKSKPKNSKGTKSSKPKQQQML